MEDKLRNKLIEELGFDVSDIDKDGDLRDWSYEYGRVVLSKSQIDKLLALFAQQSIKDRKEALLKAHRAGNSHDYDNATDEYIDEILDELDKQAKEIES